jgi:signal peptidase I
MKQSKEGKVADVKQTAGTPEKTSKKQKSAVRDLIETVVISAILATFIIVFVAQSFIVKGQSMEPTYHEGERMLVNKFIYRFTEPHRGDVVVFKPQGAPHERYIKRVIGVPGDVITIEDEQVKVNGVAIDEPYTAVPIEEDFGTYTVPEKHVFVLGDNRYRHASSDSRYTPVGYVSYKSIAGKAFVVYWPPTHIRWIQNPKYETLSVQ